MTHDEAKDFISAGNFKYCDRIELSNKNLNTYYHTEFALMDTTIRFCCGYEDWRTRLSVFEIASQNKLFVDDVAIYYFYS